MCVIHKEGLCPPVGELIRDDDNDDDDKLLKLAMHVVKHE
jgi:hypothetical protein